MTPAGTTKNLFLTGEVRVGKSTIVDGAMRALGVTAYGFRTCPEYEGGVFRGFHMEALPDTKGEPFPLIARCTEGKRVRPVLSAFESYGVRCCERALAAAPALVVMDEIGFLENDALAFRQRVLACLDAPFPLLGVLSAKPRAALPSIIRRRNDVRILDVTAATRAQVLAEVTVALHALVSEAATATGEENA